MCGFRQESLARKMDRLGKKFRWLRLARQVKKKGNIRLHCATCVVELLAHSLAMPCFTFLESMP
jgi:hypothetical protein